MKLPALLCSSFAWSSFALVLACGGDDDGVGDDGPAASTIGASADDGGAEDPLPMTSGEPPKADLGVDPPAECIFACDVRSECLGESHDDCVLACTAAHDEHAATSEACVAADETLLGCVAALSCEDVALYQAGAGDHPCAEQEIAVDGACSDDLPSPAVCDPLCATSSGCTGDDESACLTLCAEAIVNAETVGAACLAAQTALFECVATLDCPGYDAWTAGEPNAPCQAENDTLTLDCEPS